MTRTEEELPSDSLTENQQSSTNKSSTQPSEEEIAEKQQMARFVKAVFKGTDEEITSSFQERANDIASRYTKILDRYCVIALLGSHSSIDSVDLDGVFATLMARNSNHAKDVLLLLLSHGGEMEPAYQISKVCKQWSSSHFVTAIPRFAKSAATLIAIGSDEIHIGPLGHLGPIDPQLQNLPALGVSKALDSIASVCEKYPKSAPMFAQFLKGSLTVREIGYCDRIVESAVQYAERLLSTKQFIDARSAKNIARKLVHEFKHHGFVIDITEARALLGDNWIKSGTQELEFAESIYTLYEQFSYLLRRRDKQLIVVGNWENRVMVTDIPED